MAKTNNKGNVTSEEKIVTRYDRKQQKRKEEARKAAREKKITIGVCVAVLAALVIVCSVWAVSSYNRIHKEFIKVNNESVSGIEFDFYYGISKNETLSQTLYGTMTYAEYFSQYLGYDISASDKSQKYSGSEDNTWYDYFANNAVQTIMQYRALLADADKNEFTYADFDADYESLKAEIQSAADEAGVSFKQQFKDLFGSNATESSLNAFMQEYLKAVAYQEKLREDLAATDEEIAAYYEENKDNYDQVTYRQFIIKAETEADETSYAEAKEKAEAFAAAVTDETTFAENCRNYATDEQTDTYAEDSASLLSDTYKSSVDEAAQEWLFDSARTEGEVTIIEDEENSQCYVVYFVSRKYDESNNENIANTLLNNSYSELIASYTDEMTIENIKNRIKMYKED